MPGVWEKGLRSGPVLENIAIKYAAAAAAAAAAAGAVCWRGCGPATGWCRWRPGPAFRA